MDSGRPAKRLCDFCGEWHTDTHSELRACREATRAKALREAAEVARRGNLESVAIGDAIADAILQLAEAEKGWDQ